MSEEERRCLGEGMLQDDRSLLIVNNEYEAVAGEPRTDGVSA